MSDQNKEKQGMHRSTPYGSLAGFLVTVVIGFAMYFALTLLGHAGTLFSYNDVVANAGTSLGYRLVWFIMNFTEADFYAGFFASLGLIFGGFVAWRLNVRKSKYAGFEISYGTNLWPWVLASQLLSLGITIFVLNATQFFVIGPYGWLPTFICVVGAPPAIMLLYGPNYKALITSSILGGLFCFPVAFWLMNTIIPIIGMPGVVANVTAMAITGWIACKIVAVLPWMERMPCQSIDMACRDMTPKEKLKDMQSIKWFVRRVFADFSEAQFYGNEIAGALMLVGLIIGWTVNNTHGAYGSGVLPAIVLSQFVSSGVGIFLYTNKYFTNGWYATYVPVVSVGPACVLMFGGTIPVALFAAVLGGLIGPPMAEYLAGKLTDDIHITVANVTSMALTTMVVVMIMQSLPWF